MNNSSLEFNVELVKSNNQFICPKCYRILCQRCKRCSSLHLDFDNRDLCPHKLIIKSKHGRSIAFPVSDKACVSALSDTAIVLFKPFVKDQVSK